MQKARRHCQKAAPTACRRRVSGSLSPFSSKCFSPFLHSTRPLSVSREYSALPDGPGGFAQDSSCPALLRMPLCRRGLRVRGYHPLRRGFPAASPRSCRAITRSYNPRRASPHAGFGLLPGRSPLLGESLDYFLFLRVLRCFSSPGWPFRTRRKCPSFRRAGCPIRKSADQRSLAPTRGLSQLVTSFVASVSQGIRPAPLTTFLP